MDRKDHLPILAAIAAVAVLMAIIANFGPKEKPVPVPITPTALKDVVYGGNPAFTVFQTTRADVDADGDQDAIVILTEEPGGSGTFFHVAVALSEGDGFSGTNAILLGDRIAPQTVEFRDGKIIVNYAERAPGEPMTTPPSMGKSMYLAMEQGTLTETPMPQNVVPVRATLEGVLTCLPHKGDGPSTMECAMGLKTDDGTYYAFDAALMSSIPPAYDYGDRISANGVMTPVEMLSSDHWQKYDIKGIFSATDSLKIVK